MLFISKYNFQLVFFICFLALNIYFLYFSCKHKFYLNSLFRNVSAAKINMSHCFNMHSDFGDDWAGSVVGYFHWTRMCDIAGVAQFIVRYSAFHSLIPQPVRLQLSGRAVEYSRILGHWIGVHVRKDKLSSTNGEGHTLECYLFLHKNIQYM